MAEQKHTQELSQVAKDDTCPQCGSKKINYGETNWADGDQEFQECTCEDCDLEFKQWYSLIFDGQQVGDTDIEPEHKVNARLIAAAPELLEACKLLYKAWEALIPCLKNSVVQDYGLVLTTAPLAATAAINKAEGRKD